MEEIYKTHHQLSRWFEEANVMSI